MRIAVVIRATNVEELRKRIVGFFLGLENVDSAQLAEWRGPI